MAKLPVLLGNLDVSIDSVAPDVTSKSSKHLLQRFWVCFTKHRTLTFNPPHPQRSNLLSADCFTSSYVPVKNFEANGPGSALLEVEEFVPCIAKCSQPFTSYKNHLYVYPKHLKYDGQKSFAKVEFLSICTGSVFILRSNPSAAHPFWYVMQILLGRYPPIIIIIIIILCSCLACETIGISLYLVRPSVRSG